MLSFPSPLARIAFPRPHRGCTTLYLLEHPQASFPPLPSLAPFGVSTPDDWRALWATWDPVTLGMIPSEMLYQKLIDLSLFYIGHTPTSVPTRGPISRHDVN